jgi:protein involved in polysaccharide export with SLBB domain
MKALATSLLALLITSHAWSQDPKFRDAEPRRISNTTAAAPAVPTTDDTNASVGRISSMQMLDDSTPLRVGDLVSLRIVEDRDKTLSLRVQASGDIQAPHLGLVKAAGQTCKKVAFSMKRELEKQYFQQATVIVALEYRPPTPTAGGGMNSPDMQYFTVFGQVQKQGKYELLQDEELTISQALLRAGGPTGFANTKKVHVVRRTPSKGNVTINVNCDDIMKRGKLEKDIAIRPNDVIIVDEKVFNF